MWPADTYWRQASNLDQTQIAKFAYQATCRTALDEPGFCVLSFGKGLTTWQAEMAGSPTHGSHPAEERTG